MDIHNSNIFFLSTIELKKKKEKKEVLLTNELFSNDIVFSYQHGSILHGFFLF